MGQHFTDEERAARYRLLAERAHECARAAIAHEARDAYIAIASAWETLAEETARMSEVESPLLAPEATAPSDSTMRASPSALKPFP